MGILKPGRDVHRMRTCGLILPTV